MKQGAELVVDFSCSDSGGSGLASCVGSVADGALLDTSELGEASVTVTALDHAGNQTVVTHTVTVVDETKPTISVTTPAEGAEYELGEEVLADYSCADEPNGSGLDSCVGSVANGAAVDTASLGDKTFTVNASDEAGNTRSKSVTYTVVDATPPEHHRHHPGRRRGLRGGRAGGGGLLLRGRRRRVSPAAWAAWRWARPWTPDRLGEKTFTVEASDNAGNTASKTVNYTVADRTAPTITLTSPAEGAVYTLGESVLADYSCADEPNGSGVASCEGSVADGAALDTSEVGAKTLRGELDRQRGEPRLEERRLQRRLRLRRLPLAAREPAAGEPLEGGPAGAGPVLARLVPRPRPGGGRLSEPRSPAAQARSRRAGEGARDLDAELGSADPSAAARRIRSYGRPTRSGRATAGELMLKLDDGTLHRVEVQFMKHGSTPGIAMDDER